MRPLWELSNTDQRELAKLAFVLSSDPKKMEAMGELMEMARRGRRMVRRHGRKTFPKPRRRRK